MATYKDERYLKKVDHSAFDKDLAPGADAPFAGIYRCVGCGWEIGIATTHKLPPQNHHEHTSAQGPIKWRLIVYAQHKK
jgi:hypothetical protein